MRYLRSACDDVCTLQHRRQVHLHVALSEAKPNVAKRHILQRNGVVTVGDHDVPTMRRRRLRRKLQPESPVRGNGGDGGLPVEDGCHRGPSGGLALQNWPLGLQQHVRAEEVRQMQRVDNG